MLGKKIYIQDKNKGKELYSKSICEWMKDENACGFRIVLLLTIFFSM